MSREVGQEPVVVVNRAEYRNDDLKEYLKREKLEVVGEIPDDRKIAEVCSKGDIVMEKLPQYKDLFEEIAKKILRESKKKRAVKKIKKKKTNKVESEIEKAVQSGIPAAEGLKELVVISGKGGWAKPHSFLLSPLWLGE